MRGKPMLSKQDLDAARITPADAGKTCTRKHIARVNGDHPRGCGENRGRRGISARSKRITPADAGKTHSNGTHGTFSRDHPRGCGENLDVAKHFENGAGSPPRMRGKHGRMLSSSSRWRITPADAGKTERNFFLRVRP